MRSNLLIGPPWMADYTVQADVMLTQTGRRRSDGGVINQGYILDLMAIHQQVQLRSWTAVLRVQQDVKMELTLDSWYTVKLKVTQRDDDALVQGKSLIQ